MFVHYNAMFIVIQRDDIFTINLFLTRIPTVYGGIYATEYKFHWNVQV